jgi:hypothetical protein
VSRSVLASFVAGNVCGLVLFWVAGGLLASDPVEAPAPLAVPALTAPEPAPAEPQPSVAELPSVDAPAPEGVVEREPEGEPTSWVISTALLREAQARAKRVHEVLAGLGNGEESPLGVQLDVYQKALRDNLSSLPLPEVAGTREAMVDAFLWTDSVQQQFAAMNPAGRQSELNFVRRELGFSDEEVEALARDDAAREARWQNGLTYMRERYRAAASFEGEALAKELERLRAKYFADEASTIANEERDGFFRYESRRIYGVN